MPSLLQNHLSCWGKMVTRAGVQPATFALGVRRSMHLSYRALSLQCIRFRSCSFGKLEAESLCPRFTAGKLSP